MDGQRLVYQFAEVPKNIIEIDCGEDLPKKCHRQRHTLPRPYTLSMPPTSNEMPIIPTMPVSKSQKPPAISAPPPPVKTRGRSPPPLVPTTVLDNVGLGPDHLGPHIRHSSSMSQHSPPFSHNQGRKKENFSSAAVASDFSAAARGALPPMIKDAPRAGTPPADIQQQFKQAAANLAEYRESKAERIRSDDEDSSLLKHNATSCQTNPKTDTETRQKEASMSGDNSKPNDAVIDVSTCNEDEKSEPTSTNNNNQDVDPEQVEGDSIVRKVTPEVPRSVKGQAQSEDNVDCDDDDSSSEKELTIDDSV